MTSPGNDRKKKSAPMSDCECLRRCPFFSNKMARMPTIASFYQAKLCKGGNFQSCARYMVFAAKLEVPSDLFPDQVERAKTLIAGKSI